MKYALLGLVLVLGTGLWYFTAAPDADQTKRAEVYPEAAPRDPEENINGPEDNPGADDNFIEEGMVSPPDSEPALEDVKGKISSDEETPEVRAQLLSEYFRNNANKQEVFELTSELLEAGAPPVLFEKALYTHAAFLNRSEQQNLYGELSRKHSDPKLRKILSAFAAKHSF